jgi:hypothetical protein
MFSFCCRSRNFKLINENFKNIEADMAYFKNELQELREKQQQTKKNLVKIIDTFTLNEYVLFKTRLLTKKQTYDLIEEIYELYEIPLEYREDSGFRTLEQQIIKMRESGNFTFDELLHGKQLILRQVQELKQILDKLDEPGLKDAEYALKKAEWCSQQDAKCSVAFLDNVIKCIKNVI